VSDGGSSVPELDVKHFRVLASVPTASDAIRHCSIAGVLQACIAVTHASLVHQTNTFSYLPPVCGLVSLKFFPRLRI
jgi:hypothetical protein